MKNAKETEEERIIGEEEIKEDKRYFEKVRRKIHHILDCTVSIKNTPAQVRNFPVPIIVLGFDFLFRKFTYDLITPDEQKWNKSHKSYKDVYHFELKAGTIIKIIRKKDRYYVASKWRFNHLRRIPRGRAYIRTFKREYKEIEKDMEYFF